MNYIDITETELSAAQIDTTVTEIGVRDSRASFYVILSLSAVAGLWGAACLVSGIGSCSSFSSLGKGLFTAITGM